MYTHIYIIYFFNGIVSFCTTVSVEYVFCTFVQKTASTFPTKLYEKKQQEENNMYNEVYNISKIQKQAMDYSSDIRFNRYSI